MRYASGFIAACLLLTTAFASPPSSCTVYYGRHPVHPIPTGQHTKTRTITPTIIVTSLRTTTITPNPTTTTTILTETETDTTTIESTDTFTNTETDSTTIITTLPTQTLTSITTTTTSTTSTSTTTLGTTAGFTPIQSSVPDSSYNGADGGPPPSKRSLRRSGAGGSNSDEMQNVEERAPKNKKPSCLGPSKITTSVGCTQTVTTYAPTFTSTWKPALTSTITAPTPTSTVTSETTTTTTSTVVSDAQTTITTTTTSSITSTISPVTTSTSTATQTNTAIATATSYGQCNSNNDYANALGGVQGVGVSGNTVTEQQILSINNALDCCLQCASSSGCDFDLYTAQSGGCYTFTGSSFALYQAASLDWVVNNGVYAVQPAA